MPIFAHSSDDAVEKWESLDAHLQRVGGRAGDFASKLDGADWGRALGLLHDIGKAKPGFQDYILSLGKKPSVPHASEGAAFAMRHYGRACPRPFDAPIGRMLAFCIAGHHAGLANGSSNGGGLTPLNDRIDGAEDVSAWHRPVNLPVFEKAPRPLLLKEPFAWAFFTRMLFSALVDADRLETEAWSQEAKNDPTLRGWDGRLADLHAALDSHLLSRFGTAHPTDALARLRAEVLADCRAAARNPTGLYSLTVPTGGGKTLSSLAFALEHAAYYADKIDRVIYVIPFTSIVDQTADVFRGALGDVDAVLEHHSAFDDEKLKTWLDREEDLGVEKLRLAAQNWDRPIVVTAAVQFFESLFANAPGRCRKLHNIARSVVILDEAQTLPIKLIRPCLAALKELARAYGTTVVLCTATQPALTKGEFEKVSGSRPPPEALQGVCEIIAPGRNLDGRLKRVSGAVSANPLGDDQLIEALAGTDQGLVVLNNRRHARELFVAMKQSGVEGARHLSTAMTAAHRQHTLKAITVDLSHGRPVRLVSTSLIEAGVDISFKAVWRASAGLDQIVQAAGRCNRNGELGPDGGRLIIFDPEAKEGRGVPRELEQNAAEAKRVLRAGVDPLSPPAVAEYFRELLWAREDDGHWRRLDDVKVGEAGIHGIMNAIGESSRGLNFAFADIAAAFRMIEDAMVPVIIPERIDAIAGARQSLLDSIEHVKSAGGIARELQRHVVQIPRRARDALIRARSARPIAEAKLGEQFVELTNEALYSAECGLDWDDPTFRQPLIM